MPILKYVPPVKKIIDRRKPEGGYYVAKCEVCGTEFYPERSNAKYCTGNCGLIAHRTAVANGTATKQKPKNSKPTKAETIYNGKELRYFLKEQYGIPMYATKDFLQGLEVGASQKHGEVTVKRISPNRLILV